MLTNPLGQAGPAHPLWALAGPTTIYGDKLVLPTAYGWEKSRCVFTEGSLWELLDWRVQAGEGEWLVRPYRTHRATGFSKVPKLLLPASDACPNPEVHKILGSMETIVRLEHVCYSSTENEKKKKPDHFSFVLFIWLKEASGLATCDRSFTWWGLNITGSNWHCCQTVE